MRAQVILGSFLVWCIHLAANNIKVDSISVVNQDATQDFVMVEFDLSWENSWRLSSGPANYDAAWICIKYRVNNSPWGHARVHYVNGTDDGHQVPDGAMINAMSDFTGSLIYRESSGSGNVNWKNIRIRWNYGQNGVQDNDQVDLKVFAIEMVYVPQGPFYVGGTSGTEANKFYQYPSTSNSYQITSENAIDVGTVNGFLYYNAVAVGGDGLGPIPVTFPKGFKAFYCMKYELTEEQWVAFFNSLSEDQKANRDITGPGGKNSDGVVNGNTIEWVG
ncbi:MAG: hypothetical protein HKN76_02020, partial [Saprospiraceae bacterium]|nr:hypothetical protein [Saprospiraceae bacterium]